MGLVALGKILGQTTRKLFLLYMSCGSDRSSMEFDDEEAPSLIDVADESTHDAKDSAPVAQLQDISLSRVPLTIVTGKLLAEHLVRIFSLIHIF